MPRISLFRLNASALTFAAVCARLFMRISPGQFKTPLDAFYFTVISLTTVGYGDITPESREAKALFMAMSIAGIGFFGTLIETLGEWRKKQTNLGTLAELLGFGGGVLAFSQLVLTLTKNDPQMPKTLLDAVYFSVVTGTSVGYGDLYPTTPTAKVLTMAWALAAMHANAEIVGIFGSWFVGTFCTVSDDDSGQSSAVMMGIFVGLLAAVSAGVAVSS